ncbi:MAG: hypothetical protein LBK61_00735 [Spirochaetaceae bacterium]|jgi:hypothetical protein|nr:hypothetical protein [Spirochaetaceae bacterium]
MRKKYTARKIATGILLAGFIVTGFLDALLHGKITYSSIMGMDINRVYFYTFFLLVIGCWLLYNKWFVGIGFLALATFSSYFTEYIFVHNYFASVLIYIGIIIDIIVRRKMKWLIPLIIVGIIQGIAYQNTWMSYYVVGCMEFLALCIGSVFIVKTI